MFTHASKNLFTLTHTIDKIPSIINAHTMKALLIILPKRSLIECGQCNGKRKTKKEREDAAQKGNKVKASWGP